MAYTDASKRATIKYQAKAYDKISLMVPKGDRDKIYAHAELMEESGTQFIRRAIAEAIARDRARIRETLKNAPKEEPIEEE